MGFLCDCATSTPVTRNFYSQFGFFKFLHTANVTNIFEKTITKFSPLPNLVPRTETIKTLRSTITKIKFRTVRFTPFCFNDFKFWRLTKKAATLLGYCVEAMFWKNHTNLIMFLASPPKKGCDWFYVT